MENITYALKQLQGAIIGLAVGDALGVPVEFTSRAILKMNPVKSMMGFGTHNQPAGTWSDDTSLTLCLLDGLRQGYELVHIGTLFTEWLYERRWTAHNHVFDVGGTSRWAIRNLRDGIRPQLAGRDGEMDNGNGSLMRILPLAFYSLNFPIEKRFQMTKEVSSMTHRHIRSVIGCFIYTELLRYILMGLDKDAAYQKVKEETRRFLEEQIETKLELSHYDRVLRNDIRTYKEENISGSGYVVHALEASIWCFLGAESYDKTVLAAVNLGEDTDTTGAIVGGIAGLYYGLENIPLDWQIHLARYQDILDLCTQYYEGVN